MVFIPVPDVTRNYWIEKEITSQLSCCKDSSLDYKVTDTLLARCRVGYYRLQYSKLITISVQIGPTPTAKKYVCQITNIRTSLPTQWFNQSDVTFLVQDATISISLLYRPRHSPTNYNTNLYRYFFKNGDVGGPNRTTTLLQTFWKNPCRPLTVSVYNEIYERKANWQHKV